MHHSEMEEQCDVPPDTSYSMDEKSVRKLLFKKRSTSSTCAVRTFIQFYSFNTTFFVPKQLNKYIDFPQKKMVKVSYNL